VPFRDKKLSVSLCRFRASCIVIVGLTRLLDSPIAAPSLINNHAQKGTCNNIKRTENHGCSTERLRVSKS
jgi:hypothetical protein